MLGCQRSEIKARAPVARPMPQPQWSPSSASWLWAYSYEGQAVPPFRKQPWVSERVERGLARQRRGHPEWLTRPWPGGGGGGCCCGGERWETVGGGGSKPAQASPPQPPWSPRVELCTNPSFDAGTGPKARKGAKKRGPVKSIALLWWPARRGQRSLNKSLSLLKIVPAPGCVWVVKIGLIYTNSFFLSVSDRTDSDWIILVLSWFSCVLQWCLWCVRKTRYAFLGGNLIRRLLFYHSGHQQQQKKNVPQFLRVCCGNNESKACGFFTGTQTSQFTRRSHYDSGGKHTEPFSETVAFWDSEGR